MVTKSLEGIVLSVRRDPPGIRHGRLPVPLTKESEEEWIMEPAALDLWRKVAEGDENTLIYVLTLKEAYPSSFAELAHLLERYVDVKYA